VHPEHLLLNLLKRINIQTLPHVKGKTRFVLRLSPPSHPTLVGGPAFRVKVLELAGTVVSVLGNAADKQRDSAPQPYALLYRDFRNRLASREDGIEGCAPIRVTEMAATADA